ncbi:MAG: radical SAM protein, partial [Deltaproteobacteria bacterium]|nr:radical SAM protein [Deltaproteobacteria bacterium]
MIWPFDKKNNRPDKVGPVRSPPRVSALKRTWQLLQVEPALTCNLACVMCPWRGETGRSDGSGLMDQQVWAAVKPWLHEVEMVDFTGGGEPLLQPHLREWIRDAADAGCRSGFLTNGTLLTTNLTRRLVDDGLDWIGVSLDGATPDVYEAIRPGADFKRVCGSIAGFSRLKQNHRPQIILNFVMMTVNIHQLADLVRLAADLGVDRINFKQCDVIRAVNRQTLGLFGPHREKKIIALEKQVKKARRLADRLGMETTSFSFYPDEMPVCGQDPVHSLFIARDGSVAPCINTAYGGASRFFEKPVMLPRLVFGRLPEQDLMDVWLSERYASFRDRFVWRDQAYSRVLRRSQFDA